MSNLPKLTGPEFLPDDEKIDGLIILLHGLGSDGDDLISLVPHLAPSLSNIGFTAPNAPFPCDMAPMGYQWFSLQDRDPEKIRAGVKVAAPILTKFIDDQAKRFNISHDKIALLGFSQGTMMSLYIAPRMEHALGGIVGYSGALSGADTLQNEVKSTPPFLLIHGQADDVVDSSALPHAVEHLKKAGCDVKSTLTPGLGHSIDMDGLQQGAEFLHKILIK